MSGTIEEFDDDTDFALPTVSAPAAPTMGGAPGGPGGGMSMEALQQMMAQMQAGGSGGAGPSGGPGMLPPGMQQMMAGAGAAAGPPAHELTAEEKKWVTVYPIYFDAKQRYEKGCRRVAYNEASMWPKSDALERACERLTLYHVHEPRKTHPRDWQNPGRVKVQLFNEAGEPLHTKYKTKKELLRAIASIMQPSCGVPPPLPALPKPATKKVGGGGKDAKTTGDKAKAAKSTDTANKAQGAPFKNAVAHQSKPRHRVPIRLDPQQRIKAAKKADQAPIAKAQRLPVYSPNRAAGVLNADLGGMMGAIPGMGPMGSMLGAMGLGGDDDEEEGAEDDANKIEDKKAKDPLQNLGRRQRKRVIRVGR